MDPDRIVDDEPLEGKAKETPLVPSDLESFVLAVSTSALVIWSLCAFLWPFGVVSYSADIAGRCVCVAVMALTWYLHGRRPDGLPRRRMYLRSFIALAFPLCTMAASLLPAASTPLWILGCGCLGTGQAQIACLWTDCNAASLSNRQTVTVVTTGSIVAIAVFALCVPTCNDPAICVIMELSMAAVLGFAGYAPRLIPGPPPNQAAAYTQTPTRPLGAKVFIHIFMQNITYGAFYAFMVFTGFKDLAIVVAASLASAIVLAVMEKGRMRLALSPAFGQRILAAVIALGLTLFIAGDDLSLPTVAPTTSLCLMGAALCFFLISSYLLLVVESREFGFPPIAHYAQGRVPVWTGILAGMTIGGLLCALWPSDNCLVLMADGLMVAHVIATVAHQSSDPLDALHYEAETPSFVEQNAPNTPDSPLERDVSAPAIETEIEPPCQRDYPGEASPRDAFARCAEELAADARLTSRQTEVYSYLLDGKSIRYIAETLFITESTAKTHIANIYRKAGVNSRAALVGLVEHRMDSPYGHWNRN